MTLLGRLNQSLLTVRSLFSNTSSSIHTSVMRASWGGGKLKTHNGTAKRFKPVGKRLVNVQRMLKPILGPDGEWKYIPSTDKKVIGTMFKRGQTGKQHLNSKMSHSRTARLRATKVHESGHTIRTLNRLIGSHY